MDADAGSLLRRYVFAAWRYRWWALALSTVVCAAGWGAVCMIPNQYQASARLYVDADAVLTPLLRGLAVDNTPANQVDVLQRTLLSRPNLQKVIAKTDLDVRARDPAALEKLIQALGTEIKVQPQTKSLFTIEYRDASPRLAYDVVQTLITLFIESAANSDRSQMENARQFLVQQLVQYEGKLREAERRRADFQAKYLDLLPSDANGGVSRLDSARVQLRTMEGELLDATSKRDMLARELGDTPQMLTTQVEAAGGGGGGGDGRSAAAERSLQELRLRYTDQHPDVIAARNLVQALRGSGGGGGGAPRVSTRSRSQPNPMYDQVKVRLIDANAAVASLQRQVGDASKERDRLEAVARTKPEVQAEFTNIDRDYNVLRHNYEELLNRRESVRIAAAASTDSEKMKLDVVDPPTVPRNPVAPKRPLLLSGVLAAGLGAGAVLALLLVQLDRSFYTTQDLRRMGLPVLGGISLATVDSPAHRIRSATAFAIGLLLLAIAYGGVITAPIWLGRFA